MEIRFDGKKALVTGAGKGIGRSIAKALANGGAETHALSRTKADLDSLKEEVPRILTHEVDLTDFEKSRMIIQHHGPFDLLVNNAAIYIPGSFVETAQVDFDKILDTNLRAVFNVSQVIAKGMMKRGGGSIVNISSICAARVHQESFAYSVAKSGVEMMTKFMALELGPYKIRVNSIQPTLVMTDLAKQFLEDPDRAKLSECSRERTPLKRFAELEEIVHPMLYLLSDKSGMITGTQVPVDGGFLVT